MEPAFPNQGYTSIETEELEALRQRVAVLEDWKAQASKVLDGLQLQEIGKEIGLQIGQDIGPAILPWIRNQKAQASKVSMAPHVFAQMVNRVRDLAFDFGTSEQFRDRVSELLGEYIDSDAKARAVVVPPLPKPTGRRADDAPIWGMPQDLEDVCRQAGNPVLAAYQVGIRRGHAIAENSVCAIPADRVLGEGMVQVDPREWNLMQAVRSAADQVIQWSGESRSCGETIYSRDARSQLVSAIKSLDSLRANQGGAACV